MIANFKNFEIKINKEVYDKMFNFVMESKGEVSGFGKVDKIDNKFYIKDVFAPEQKNTFATTEIDSKHISRILVEMAKRGYDSADWRCWWHSHGNGSVFFSGTDLNTIEKFMEFGNKDFYLISIVVNRFNEILCRIDIKSFINFYILDVPIRTNGIKPLLLKTDTMQFVLGRRTSIDSDNLSLKFGHSFDNYGEQEEVWNL